MSISTIPPSYFQFEDDPYRLQRRELDVTVQNRSTISESFDDDTVTVRRIVDQIDRRSSGYPDNYTITAAFATEAYKRKTEEKLKALNNQMNSLLEDSFLGINNLCSKVKDCLSANQVKMYMARCGHGDTVGDNETTEIGPREDTNEDTHTKDYILNKLKKPSKLKREGGKKIRYELKKVDRAMELNKVFSVEATSSPSNDKSDNLKLQPYVTSATQKETLKLKKEHHKHTKHKSKHRDQVAQKICSSINKIQIDKSKDTINAGSSLPNENKISPQHTLGEIEKDYEKVIENLGIVEQMIACINKRVKQSTSGKSKDTKSKVEKFKKIEGKNEETAMGIKKIKEDLAASKKDLPNKLTTDKKPNNSHGSLKVAKTSKPPQIIDHSSDKLDVEPIDVFLSDGNDNIPFDEIFRSKSDLSVNSETDGPKSFYEECIIATNSSSEDLEVKKTQVFVGSGETIKNSVTHIIEKTSDHRNQLRYDPDDASMRLPLNNFKHDDDSELYESLYVDESSKAPKECKKTIDPPIDQHRMEMIGMFSRRLQEIMLKNNNKDNNLQSTLEEMKKAFLKNITDETVDQKNKPASTHSILRCENVPETGNSEAQNLKQQGTVNTKETKSSKKIADIVSAKSVKKSENEPSRKVIRSSKPKVMKAHFTFARNPSFFSESSSEDESIFKQEGILAAHGIVPNPKIHVQKQCKKMMNDLVLTQGEQNFWKDLMNGHFNRAVIERITKNSKVEVPPKPIALVQDRSGFRSIVPDVHRKRAICDLHGRMEFQMKACDSFAGFLKLMDRAKRRATIEKAEKKDIHQKLRMREPRRVPKSSVSLRSNKLISAPRITAAIKKSPGKKSANDICKKYVNSLWFSPKDFKLKRDSKIFNAHRVELFCRSLANKQAQPDKTKSSRPDSKRSSTTSCSYGTGHKKGGNYNVTVQSLTGSTMKGLSGKTYSASNRMPMNSSKRHLDFCDILDDLTTKDLEPFNAEYPRKDEVPASALADNGVQGSLLYKLVYGKKDHEGTLMDLVSPKLTCATAGCKVCSVSDKSVVSPTPTSKVTVLPKKRKVPTRKPPMGKRKTELIKNPSRASSGSDYQSLSSKATARLLLQNITDIKTKNRRKQLQQQKKLEDLQKKGMKKTIRRVLTDELGGATQRSSDLIRRNMDSVKKIILDTNRPGTHSTRSEASTADSERSRSSARKSVVSKLKPYIVDPDVKVHQTLTVLPVQVYYDNPMIQSNPRSPNFEIQSKNEQPDRYRTRPTRHDRPGVMGPGTSFHTEGWDSTKIINPATGVQRKLEKSKQPPSQNKAHLPAQPIIPLHAPVNRNDLRMNIIPKNVKSPIKRNKPMAKEPEKKVWSGKYGRSVGERLIKFIENQPSPQKQLGSRQADNRKTRADVTSRQQYYGLNNNTLSNDEQNSPNKRREMMDHLQLLKNRNYNLQHNIQKAIGIIESKMFDVIAKPESEKTSLPYGEIEQEITEVLAMMQQRSSNESIHSKAGRIGEPHLGLAKTTSQEKMSELKLREKLNSIPDTDTDTLLSSRKSLQTREIQPIESGSTSGEQFEITNAYEPPSTVKQPKSARKAMSHNRIKSTPVESVEIRKKEKRSKSERKGSFPKVAETSGRRSRSTKRKDQKKPITAVTSSKNRMESTPSATEGSSLSDKLGKGEKRHSSQEGSSVSRANSQTANKSSSKQRKRNISRVATKTMSKEGLGKLAEAIKTKTKLIMDMADNAKTKESAMADSFPVEIIKPKEPERFEEPVVVPEYQILPMDPKPPEDIPKVETDAPLTAGDGLLNESDKPTISLEIQNKGVSESDSTDGWSTKLSVTSGNSSNVSGEDKKGSEMFVAPFVKALTHLREQKRKNRPNSAATKVTVNTSFYQIINLLDTLSSISTDNTEIRVVWNPEKRCSFHGAIEYRTEGREKKIERAISDHSIMVYSSSSLTSSSDDNKLIEKKSSTMDLAQRLDDRITETYSRNEEIKELFTIQDKPMVGRTRKIVKVDSLCKMGHTVQLKLFGGTSTSNDDDDSIIGEVREDFQTTRIVCVDNKHHATVLKYFYLAFYSFLYICLTTMNFKC